MKNNRGTLLVLCFCLAIQFNSGNSQDKCQYMHFQQDTRTNTTDACNLDICNKTFDIIRVEYPPYDDADIITRILKECCGRCFNYSIIPIPVENLSPEVIKIVHFAYPFLGGLGANTLYGHNFIPIAPAPSLFYVTAKNKAVMEQLMAEAITLYPMIIICLLMAIISGFIAWILETWFNEGEFPRPFLIGWFEGFWWSFISMTTVGYGDKTPKTIVARLFSVIWILMGVALFGIVSGEITKIIMQANSPSQMTLFGARVGILNYREYEASYVAMHGGLIARPKRRGDFNEEILELVSRLRTGGLDGILLDKRTLAYTLDYFNDNINAFSETSSWDDVEFVLNNTMYTEKKYDGERLAYGVVVRDSDDYAFFRDAFVDNRVSLVISRELKWNEAQQRSDKSNAKLFEPASPLFFITVLCLVVIIACISVFGVCYEVRRRSVNNCCNRKSCQEGLNQNGNSQNHHNVNNIVL